MEMKSSGLPVNVTELEKALDGKEEGECMTLDSSGIHLMLLRSGVSDVLLEAFRQGVVRYTYWESSTPAPIPVWVFFFSPPLDAFDVTLDINLPGREGVDAFLGSVKERRPIIHMTLVESCTSRAKLEIPLHPRAEELFTATLSRWRRMPYGEQDYLESRATVRRFNVSALARFGMPFHGPSVR